MVLPSAGSQLEYQIFRLTAHTTDEGSLFVADLHELGYGAYRRFGFICAVPGGAERGGHAHKQQGQIVVCVQGGCDIRLESHGRSVDVPLRQTGLALYLPAGYWRDLRAFTSDAIVALLAPEPFLEADYIRDYSAFLAWESNAT
jgi:hypothetical protein